MKSDIEIAQEAKLIRIDELAHSAGLSDDEFEPYGRDKAKVSFHKDRQPHGKLILVTATSGMPAGSGKTTIGRAIVRINPITNGEVLFKGRRITGKISRELDNEVIRSCQMIFQDPMTSLNPTQRIGKQIEEAVRVHETVSEQEARQRAISMLEKVGVPGPEERILQYPHEFSGGMRQRVMIAMGLACDPQLLIADEPTTALDVTIQAQILELIKQIQQEKGISVLLITHDLGVVANMADKVAVMYAGKIVETGTCRQVMKTPMHPYTKALLAAKPTTDQTKGEKLVCIEGMPPSLLNPPKGCAFADRCSYCTEKCRNEQPKEKVIEGQHKASCHLLWDEE